jgi:1,4-dihydroxy-2-naphthoate octaprenyltransferase
MAIHGCGQGEMMWRNWLLAARPKTLLASVCPVAMGTALAERDGSVHWPAALAALGGAIAIQIGTNFCNDYFDFRQGADTPKRQGPMRAVQAGLISPSAMWNATLAMFGTAAALSIYLVIRAGWPLAIIGGLSIACGIAYTASRFSLAYLGLGDLFVLTFFGPVAVAGTHYVQALRLAPSAIVAGMAPGLISVGILVVNNLRDIREDALAKKRTLAVRFGADFARRQFALCMLGAALVPLILWRDFDFPAAILVASAILLPGLLLARQLWRRAGPALNPLLGATAGVLLLYTLLFSSALVLF